MYRRTFENNIPRFIFELPILNIFLGVIPGTTSIVHKGSHENSGEGSYDKKSAYSYLNRTIESFPYGSDFCNLMEEAGFKSAAARPLTFGIATLYSGEKR